MPLEEISPNIRRDGNLDSSKQEDVAGTTSTTSLRSSAVQNMLKTTTELGDTGPFAVRPPRIPRSGSRLQSTRPRSGSFDTSFASQLHHQTSPHKRHPHRRHGPRPVPSSSGLSGRETVHSSSQHSGLRSKRAGHRHKSPRLHNLGPGQHGLYTHRSLITLRSQRDLRSLHSSSPMIRSVHGRRHVHRTSSPAFSESQAYRYASRPGYSRVGSALTVGSSPGIFPRRPGMPGYRPELNNSYSSFVRFPSPAMSAMNVATVGNGYTPQRTVTPMSNSLQSLRKTWNNSATSLAGLPKSPTESTAPRYYDYSESFLEEDCFSPLEEDQGANLPFTMDQKIMGDQRGLEHQQAQSPFGTMPGSAYRPAELPTTHNRRASEVSKYSYAGVIPPRKSSLAATTTPMISRSTTQRVGLPRFRSFAGRQMLTRCS